MNSLVNPKIEHREGYNSPPTYEKLRELYHLRNHSIVYAIGICLLIAGFAVAGIALVISVTDLASLIPEVNTFLHIDKWLLLGVTAFTLGVLIITADYCKRRFICPYPYEIRGDFVRAILQEGLLPNNFDKTQFRFRVRRKKGNLYEVRFSLDLPNSDFNTLQAPMKRIAVSFGCANTYSFTEDIAIGSKYSRGYRYCLQLGLSDLASAYESAGV